MGLEGAVSTAYFSCLSGLVPPEVAFDGHSRRPRTWPTPPSPTPTRSCWPSARALCWPPGSCPRSGCCTPPPTSVADSPWTSTRRARLARRAGGLGLPVAGVRLPAAAGARRARRGAAAGHRDHQRDRRRHPPLPAVRLLPVTQRGPQDRARAQRRRTVPRSVVSRQRAKHAQFTNAPRPARRRRRRPYSCATISAAGRGDECCRDGRLGALHDAAVPRCGCSFCHFYPGLEWSKALPHLPQTALLAKSLSLALAH